MRVLRVLLKSGITTIIFFVLAECGLRAAYFVRNSLVRYVPLPYVVGDDYGPIPPWLDNLLILRPDDTLIWKNIPNARRTYVDIFTPVWSDRDRIALLRRFAPWLPPAFRSNPVWEIALNSNGYRSPEVVAEKRRGIRIACLGDSWTFGMNVSQNAAYPSRLEALLKERHPEQSYEVVNFGVLGYSSFQGLQLFETRVLDYAPDVLLVGFGMNDSEVAGYRDKDMVQATAPNWRDRLKAAEAASETYQLLKYTALVLRFRPQSTGDYLNADASKPDERVNYDEIEPWTRVSPRDFGQNIRRIISLARGRGAKVVLLDNELWPESPYRAALQTIAREQGTPLVDSVQIIADRRRQIERELETRFGVQPSPDSAPQPASASMTTVVFRVYQNGYQVPGRLSITGTDRQLGATIPNTVMLHDDGLNGDERANDQIWSLRAEFPAGAHIRYVYTNSGRQGQWEGLDVPHIRELHVPSSGDGRPVYLPIESFGRIYMQADNWHTDAVGYDLIARDAADAIEHTAR